MTRNTIVFTAPYGAGKTHDLLQQAKSVYSGFFVTSNPAYIAQQLEAMGRLDAWGVVSWADVLEKKVNLDTVSTVLVDDVEDLLFCLLGVRPTFAAIHGDPATTEAQRAVPVKGPAERLEDMSQ